MSENKIVTDLPSYIITVEQIFNNSLLSRKVVGAIVIHNATTKSEASFGFRKYFAEGEKANFYQLSDWKEHIWHTIRKIIMKVSCCEKDDKEIPEINPPLRGILDTTYY
jgi:hypothetical protein